MSEDVIADPDSRNEWGLPRILVNAHPMAAQHTEIDNSNRKNDALPWIAMSWLLSGIAIGGIFLMAMMLPRFIESRVQQGVADAKAASAQELADAKAEMHLSATNALLAKDRADKMAAALEARGLIKLENH